MTSRVSETTLRVLFDASYFVVPFVAALVIRRGHRWLAALGLPAAAIEWLLAYRDNQDGDWNPGLELALFTGVFALIYYLPLWLLGVWVGRAVRRRLGGLSRDRPVA
jgi:cytochrome c biogenesis protein CcdA